MEMLACDERSVFVGQNVRYDGQRMHRTLDRVPMDRRVEFPVAEDFQLGYCTGLSLCGKLPVCIYPRIDFLILAANQLVNHLDKVAEMSGYLPKVIIRTAVGASSPFSAGPQHSQDHTEALRLMLKNTPVFRIERAAQAVHCYRSALVSKTSTVIVEYMEHYDE